MFRGLHYNLDLFDRRSLHVPDLNQQKFSSIFLPTGEFTVSCAKKTEIGFCCNAPREKQRLVYPSCYFHTPHCQFEQQCVVSSSKQGYNPLIDMHTLLHMAIHMHRNTHTQKLTHKPKFTQTVCACVCAGIMIWCSKSNLLPLELPPILVMKGLWMLMADQH